VSETEQSEETKDSKRGFMKAARSFIPILFFGLITGALTLHALNPARSARLEMLSEDHLRLQAEVEHLTRQGDRLKVELRSLEEGSEGWRDVARRDFGMIAPGEVVFRFPVDE
jgi:cell division protein FtsB